jgi:hypothetical protein
MESKHEAFLVSFVSPFLCSVRFSGGYYGVQFLQCPQTKHLSLQKVSKCIRNAIYSTMRAQNVVTLRSPFYGRGEQKPGDKILCGAAYYLKVLSTDLALRHQSGT